MEIVEDFVGNKETKKKPLHFFSATLSQSVLLILVIIFAIRPSPDDNQFERDNEGCALSRDPTRSTTLKTHSFLVSSKCEKIAYKPLRRWFVLSRRCISSCNELSGAIFWRRRGMKTNFTNKSVDGGFFNDLTDSVCFFFRTFRIAENFCDYVKLYYRKKRSFFGVLYFEIRF